MSQLVPHVDPRRPERIQRYVAPTAVVNASGERKDVPGEVSVAYE